MFHKEPLKAIRVKRYKAMVEKIKEDLYMLTVMSEIHYEIGK